MNKLVLDEEEKTVLTYEEKIEKARRTLRLAADMSQTYYNAPLILTYSGGKDSDCLLHLAETTLKPSEFEVLNSHTTIDPPEVVYLPYSLSRTQFFVVTSKRLMCSRLRTSSTRQKKNLAKMLSADRR